jgi:hypothetical protein
LDKFHEAIVKAIQLRAKIFVFIVITFNGPKIATDGKGRFCCSQDSLWPNLGIESGYPVEYFFVIFFHPIKEFWDSSLNYSTTVYFHIISS